MTQGDLGAFLRDRRAALRPQDVGLNDGGRRRTPGLRREEVAILANMSVDYYERLERGRGTHPSETLLSGLARALRLSIDERNYMYRLAGFPAPTDLSVSRYVEPAMMFLLDSLTTVPAHVIDDLTTVLAQNALNVALLGSWTGGDNWRWSNVTWRWFTDPASRALNPAEEREAIGRGYVADLRAASARRARDPIVERLITDLCDASDEFARYWNDIEVTPLGSTRKILTHDRAGLLDVQCDVVLSSTTGQRMVIFRPQPGSGTAEKFDFLRVLGRQRFEQPT
jgi:transcriptional regulator with XRE-family HTH domain